MAGILAYLLDDTFPAAGDVGVPLKAPITILFDREMDETSVDENFFLEGPDTDQYVGPGLLELQYPDNTSQGDLDDFLKSPGYRGIVQGTTTFSKIDMSDSSVTVTGSPYRTKVILTPTQPLYALTEYTAMISDCYDADGILYSGIVTFSFTSGSGSIQEVPSTVSTSILATTATAGTSSSTAQEDLFVVSTTPIDHAIEQSLSLPEIVITFNKTLDASAITGENVIITVVPASDHPNISVTSLETLAKSITVDGKRLRLRI